MKNPQGRAIAQTYADYVAAVSGAGGGGEPKPAEGGAGSSNPRETVLREFEESIVGQNYESGALVNPDGDIVLKKDGSENRIVWDELKTMSPEEKRDLALTHNHPDRVDTYGDYGLVHEGGSFSPADISTTMRNNFSSIRAVTKDYIYEASRPEGWNTWMHPQIESGTGGDSIWQNKMANSAANDWDTLHKRETDKAKDELNAWRDQNPGISKKELFDKAASMEVEVLHLTNQALADRYGYNYKRTPRS